MMQLNFFPHLSSLVLFSLLTSATHAVTVVNGSFENLTSAYVNTPGADSMSGVAADGWTASSNSPDWFLGAPGPTGFWFTPWGDFFTVGAAEGSPYREGISQTITGLSIGESYTITFQQANGLRFDQGSHIGAGNTGGWEVLIDGGSVLTSNSLNDNTTPTAAFPDSWNMGSVTFVALAESQSVEFLAFGGTAMNPTFQFLDTVTVVQAQVPEPSTTLLLASSGFLLLSRRRM